MLTTEKINDLLQINESYKAPAKLMKILYDREAREELFKQFLEVEHDVSYDWFHIYFQDEHAQRKTHKQDFTPNSVSMLLSKLAGAGPGTNLDTAAGSGGLTIQKWNEDRVQVSPFVYKPSMYFYTCEELSDRALPFLLFNLLIRGMNALVLHCDALSREAYGAFLIQNDRDDHTQFSSLNIFPYTENTKKHMAVKFVEKRYEPLIESPANFWDLPAFASLATQQAETIEGQADLFEFI